MKYQVAIGDRMMEVDLTGSVPRIDGQEVDARLVAVPGTPLRHLIVDGASHLLVASRGEKRGEWRLLLGGRPVNAEALDERTRAIRAMAGAVADESEKTIVAPMPGLVVHVHVRPGDEIEAGQGVVIVEAMKMENELKAPAAGVVARVEVVSGQAVEKGAVLVILE